MGWKEKEGVYIPGWRLVFKSLVASTKTLCSAPCLLNRAKLIWVCLGLLPSSLWQQSASLLFSLLHLNLRGSPSRSRTLWLGTWLLTHMYCSERNDLLSRRPVHQNTWWIPAAICASFLLPLLQDFAIMSMESQIVSGFHTTHSF